MPPAHARPWPTKQPVDPNRVRRMPTQFAPIDRRLVYDGHTRCMTPQQLALYLFLQCVGDAAGLSYYSDERICQDLHFALSDLREARQGLIQCQFLLYRRPMYQLLDLPKPTSVACAGLSVHRHAPPPQSRCAAEAIPISSVVNALWARGFST